MSSSVQLTALIYGTLAVILFLMPYFLYSKEFFDPQGSAKKGEYFELISKVVGIHLVAAFVIMMLTGAVNIVTNANPDMQPTRGLELFFNTSSGDWEHLIEYLLNYSPSVGSTYSSPLAESSASSYALVLNFFAVFLAMFMTIIPIGVLTASFSIAISAQEGKAEESMMSKVFTSFMAFFLMTLLVMFHSLIASAYVSAFTGVNFSFFKILSMMWHNLLLG